MVTILQDLLFFYQSSVKYLRKAFISKKIEKKSANDFFIAVLLLLWPKIPKFQIQQWTLSSNFKSLSFKSNEVRGWG